MLKAVLFLSLLLVNYSFLGVPSDWVDKNKIKVSESENRWVDSVFNSITDDERIGQLFMIRAHSDKGPEHIAEVERQIKKYKVGGLCFFQGTPLKQAELTNNYQSLSKTPLMVAIDAEWGLGMRHKEAAISFPRQLTLGALAENKLIYEMGVEIARQLKRIGTQINFAPVVDININPANPVINDRSFGENRMAVTSKSFQYMMGMQDEGLMACAKHFPGHGDTDVDSHLDLPLINHSRSRLDSIELFPFRLLFTQGMKSVMVAHLQVPSLEKNPKTPTSLSASTMTDLIKKEYAFDGLIFSDALEMKGVTKNYNAGELEAVAFKAGCDILCLPNNIDLSVAEIKKLIQSDPTEKEHLYQTVKKIIRAKYKLGLNNYQPVSLSNLSAEVNNAKAQALKYKLYEQAVTVVKNKGNLLPITELDQHKIGSLSIGSQAKTSFQWRLDSYAKINHQQADAIITEVKSKALLTSFKPNDIVLVSLHGMNKYNAQNFGLSASALAFIKSLSSQTRVILVSFGSPYALKNFENLDWLVQSYEEDKIMQDITAQTIFGALGCKGKLPVTACPAYPFGSGIITESLMRFGYSLPEEVGILSSKLASLDVISQDIVDTRCAPGGQIFIAKEGKIIYEKSFGYLNYEKKTPVSNNTLYDVASITKIASSTLSVMRLYEEGKINLDHPIAEYLPDLQGSNKDKINFKEVMSHQAGLISWIPFYKETLLKVKKRIYKPDPKFYSNHASSKYSLPVAKDLYLKSDYDRLIWKEIVQSEMRNSTNYLYSDLGFYMISQLVRFQSGMRLDQYVKKYFYQPLGLSHTLYNAYQVYASDMIAPSEDDDYWRKKRIQGYVHDMGAAMMDGVSGHAGLFSNASELGTIMQTLLNGGQYGGEKLFHPSTIGLFASRQLNSTRRGLGFDMKELDPTKKQSASYLCSSNTYGHTGFTGSATWVDPDHQLVFVFLCNRTFPSMDNNKLHQQEYRLRLLDAVYAAMEFPVQGGENTEYLNVK